MHAARGGSVMIDDVDARVERLERRLEREREAREQAERIAERGMRDLWQTNRDLERRVEERTQDLHRSLRSATMAADAKERFLAELGHELTSPLHAVLGLLELIDATPLAPEDRDRLDQVSEHAATLSGLLHGLVELAGAEGAALPADLAEASPSEWVDDLADRWVRPAAWSGQLIVPEVTGEPGPIVLDWRRLARISDVVLDNVVEHAEPGSVRLTLDVGDTHARIEVADVGPGMTPEQIATASEPFVKHGPAGGVGIGLAVAQRLAESGNGHLRIESDDRGTLVTVTMPRVR